MRDRQYVRPAAVLFTILLTAGCGQDKGDPARQRDFAPDISPDGKTLAFYSYRADPTPDLYLLEQPDLCRAG